MYTKHKNNRIGGFTLVEALIALAIMALVLTPLFGMLSSLFQSVYTRSNNVERILQAKTFLIDARRALPEDAHEFLLEKKTGKPVTILKYTLTEVSKESNVRKNSHLCLEQVSMEWQEGSKKKSSVLTGYLLRPKSTKK